MKLEGVVSGVFGGIVYFYDTITNNLYGQSTVIVPPQSQTGLQDVALPLTQNGSYTFTTITATGLASQMTNFAVSQVNPNYIFATDSAGVIYGGNLNILSINFTALSSLYPNPYSRINTIPTYQGAFDTYAYNYTISSQVASGSYHYDDDVITGVARNAISGEFLIASSGNELRSFAPQDFSVNWLNTSIPDLNLIFSKNGEDIDVGDVNIYDFNTLVLAINAAFAEAHAKAPAGLFAQAPQISLNFQSGLATMTYSSDYTASPQVGILMNSRMHQLLYFYSLVDNFNPNLFQVVLAPSSTSITQTSKSMYLFNQLDKILFISNTISVFGSYFGQNNTNNIISDFDVPTNEPSYALNNIGNVLYVQPNFLRPFILASNVPLSRIAMQVWYSTLNGEQYPLEIVPQGNWNMKLLFARRY
jgi:hypothetical protein